MLEEKDTEIDKLKHQKIVIEEEKHEPSHQNNYDKEYVKISLIKYLEYIAAGNEKEAMTLEKVLFTVLNTN